MLHGEDTEPLNSVRLTIRISLPLKENYGELKTGKNIGRLLTGFQNKMCENKMFC